MDRTGRRRKKVNCKIGIKGGGGGGDSLQKSGSSETKEAHTSCIAKYFEDQQRKNGM